MDKLLESTIVRNVQKEIENINSSISGPLMLCCLEYKTVQIWRLCQFLMKLNLYLPDDSLILLRYLLKGNGNICP